MKSIDVVVIILLFLVIIIVSVTSQIEGEKSSAKHLKDYQIETDINGWKVWDKERLVGGNVWDSSCAFDKLILDDNQ